MGYTVPFFSYATKRKSCGFARISSIIARISCSVGISITSYISFVSVQTRKLIHSAVPPLPKKSFDFSGTPKLLFLLPFYPNAVPAPESHRSVAMLFPKKKSSHSHISFSRSFTCNRLLGNKKSRYINAYRPIQKDRLIPCGFGITSM